MWYIIVFIAAYVLAIFTWPPLRLWLKGLIEHPTQTISADIEVLKEKLHKLRVGS